MGKQQNERQEKVLWEQSTQIFYLQFLSQQIHVFSAKSLDAAEQAQVTRELTGSLGRTVDVVFEVQSELISGLKIHIGSQVFDNTVLGRLTSMQDQLTKG